MFKIKLHDNKEQVNRKLWFTSDTHFGHKNICKGVTEWSLERSKDSVRDFATLDEMNATLVNNINSNVGQDDILFNLGDWSFGGFENIRKFREQIVCKNIYIVTGNHDHHILNNRENIRDIFTEVFEHYKEIEIEYYNAHFKRMEKVKFVLCHFPIASWTDMAKGMIHLHGHVHLNHNHKLGIGRSLDVGVDGNNFMPYEFRDILNMLKDQPVHSLVLAEDHHQKEI